MDNVTHTLIGALIGEGAARMAPPAASERAAALRRTLFLGVMIVGSVYLVFTLLADILFAALNPRIRFEAVE